MRRLVIPQCTRKSIRRLAVSNTVLSKTHFGEQVVDQEKKQQLVNKVFSNVASSYDQMNDVMSLGIHRCWKDWFVAELSPRQGTKMLDMAGGTGDISFRALQHAQTKYGKNKANFSITVSDINADMLAVGEERAQSNPAIDDSCLTFEVADAHQLQFENDTFDYYTIAFGIRNCTDINKVLDEAYRVLKPGGRFMCLEFSPNVCPLLKPAYDLYSYHVIPPMGQVIAGDWDSYQYLVESIRKFPSQDDFSLMIEAAGFQAVRHQNYTGGIAVVHDGFKI